MLIVFCWGKVSLCSSGLPWTHNHPAPAPWMLLELPHITSLGLCFSSNLSALDHVKKPQDNPKKTIHVAKLSRLPRILYHQLKAAVLNHGFCFTWIFIDNNWKIRWKFENWCNKRWFQRFFIVPKVFFYEKYRPQDSRQLGVVNIPLHFIPGKKDSESISAP